MSLVRYTGRSLVVLGLVLSVGCDADKSIAGTDAQLAAVLLTPLSTSVTAGNTLQFSATPVDPSGQPLSGHPVSWSTSNASVAVVNGQGVVTAVAPGTVVIIAAAMGGKVASAQLRVTPPPGAPPAPVGSVVVSPPSGTLDIGGNIQFSADAYDLSGILVSGLPVTWTTSDAAVAQVSATGLVTALASGAAIISATIGDKTGAGAVVVRTQQGGGGGGPPPPPTVATVGISPNTASVTTGSWVQFSATPYDASGNALSGHAASWSSSNNAVASVSSSGLVTALAAGSATITANIDGKTAAATITITAPAAPPPPPGGGGTTPTVATVSLTPATGSIAVNGTLQLSATARDASGNVVSGQTVTWSTTNSTVATVSAIGLVTGKAGGAATISATIGGKVGSAAVTVSSSSPPPPPNPNTQIYASHDFNDGSLGPFTGLATSTGICNFNGVQGQCSQDVWVRNGHVEIKYERLDIASSGDRNRGIKWSPKDQSESTPHGSTIYVAGTWVIPSVTAAARLAINTAATALGLPLQTDAEQADLQRKLIYVNPGRTNHWVLKIHGLSLQFVTSVGGAPCSTTAHAQPIGVHRFTAAELLDKPQRIEIEVKRSSGVRTPDGEAKIWVNGVMVKQITGFCTNEDNNTNWDVQIGQQISYSKDVAELFSEMRVLDDVVVANRRPF